MARTPRALAFVLAFSHVQTRFTWFVWIAITYLISGCGGVEGRDGPVQIVMNPDSTAFAYALEFTKVPAMYSDLGGSAHVEVWTYDLANRRGPKKVASWPHHWESTYRLAGWTQKGLFIESFGPQGSKPRRQYEKVDSQTGLHFPTPDPSDYLRSERPGAPPSYQDSYLRTRHVEEHFGMFSVWDPVAYRLIPLFELPIHPPDGGTREESIHNRDVQIRQEGVQDIASVSTTSSEDGLTLHVRTFARRPAAFVRSYRMRVTLEVPEPGKQDNEIVMTDEAFSDTTVVPDPAGETFHLYFPYQRFIEVLRLKREIVRDHGRSYSAKLEVDLVPDPIQGDEILPPGIRDGRMASERAFVDVPVR
jgi:hypothetical protein